MTVRHSMSGSGFRQRVRSVVRFDFTRLDTDIADTDGVTPSASAYVVLDRPVQSAGAITTAHLQSLVGWLVDAFCVSGQFDKILNLEA
jgi:hypothetical protein